MLKHLITSKCNRACDYCITRNVKEKQSTDLFALKQIYLSAYRAGHKSIMLTGGEPTLAPNFHATLFLAFTIFDEVYLTTNNINWVTKPNKFHCLLHGITISAHDFKASWMDSLDFSVSMDGPPIYVSILDYQYVPGMEEWLWLNNFAGLTVGENHWGKNSFDESILQQPSEAFSVRVTRKGCEIGSSMILPDLRVIADFSHYMLEPGAAHDHDYKKLGSR